MSEPYPLSTTPPAAVGEGDWKCHDCSRVFPQVKRHGAGTGYGIVEVAGLEVRVCYACCGVRDREAMASLPIGGKYTLYLEVPAAPTVRGLDGGECWRDCQITNWPGTLCLRGRAKRTARGFGGRGWDVWFRAWGKYWYGVQMGDNQLLRVMRVKPWE